MTEHTELFVVSAGESQLFADVFWQRCAGAILYFLCPEAVETGRVFLDASSSQVMPDSEITASQWITADTTRHYLWCVTAALSSREL